MINNISIILVKPQMGENIGAAARAMLNFGLTDLRLVKPRDGWPNQAANANSSGALELMPDVQLFDDVESAISDATYVYATTARPRDMRKEVLTPAFAASEIAETDKKVAILFGGERAGLTNDELSYAQKIICIPTNEDFSSINLGQSVLLVAYELMQNTKPSASAQLPEGDSPAVGQDEFNNYINRLEGELETHNFFRNPDMRPTLMNNIRSLYGRCNLSEQEVRTLQGILSALIGHKI